MIQLLLFLFALSQPPVITSCRLYQSNSVGQVLTSLQNEVKKNTHDSLEWYYNQVIAGRQSLSPIYTDINDLKNQVTESGK